MKKGAHLPARPFSYLNATVPTAPNISVDNSDRLHHVRQTNHRSVWTCAQLDRVQYVQTISDCTHNGILTVQEVTRFKHNEKLAVRAVWVLRTRHTNNTTISSIGQWCLV